MGALCAPPLTTETEAWNVCRSNYRRLTPERIEALAKLWPVTHIIVEVRQALPLPLLYANEGFRLYAIPQHLSPKPSRGD